VRTFHRGVPVTPSIARRFERVAPLPPVEIANPPPGLHCAVFAGTFERLPDFGSLTAVRELQGDELAALAPGPQFEARVYSGFLHVPTTGVYRFALSADDGARLAIDGVNVVDHDGLHSASEKSGFVALAAGPHALRIDYFNKTGDAELRLEWGLAGEALHPVQGAALGH
jgi:hypothetical protein